ncbi:MAG: hypothetical protein U5L76_03150 [Patescibacteria group bacterium]|nr:hypothetical protein [Patescibacteria group bacterium]
MSLRTYHRKKTPLETINQFSEEEIKTLIKKKIPVSLKNGSLDIKYQTEVQKCLIISFDKKGKNFFFKIKLLNKGDDKFIEVSDKEINVLCARIDLCQEGLL